ncbi:MAG: hypothetical protein HZA22_07805 [Nitrospirae bacterium]|nr:hypothetical protein [Nitrospirota bacterium]
MVEKSVLMKKCGVIGASIGVAMFAVFGLLQGAAIGGTAGLSLINYLFGETTLRLMANELLPRAVIAAAMLAGVGISFVAFVVAGSAIGAAGGYLVSVAQGADATDAGYEYAEASETSKD